MPVGFNCLDIRHSIRVAVHPLRRSACDWLGRHARSRAGGSSPVKCWAPLRARQTVVSGDAHLSLVASIAALAPKPIVIGKDT
jgi:hypothetical protein